MTKNVMISLLRKGETGDQILEILESLIDEKEPIEFWLRREEFNTPLFLCLW